MRRFTAAIVRYLLLGLGTILFSGTVWALSPHQIKTTQTPFGAQIEFIEGDFILAEGLDVEETGWQRRENPHIYQMADTGWRIGDYHSLVGRFFFERQAIGDEPIALYTISTRNNFTLSVNGVEVFRNFADVSDENTPWYRPFLIPIPGGTLKPGMNEIVILAVSKESVGIGRVIVGPNAALKQKYEAKYFWQITAPAAVNFAMLLLGALVFLLWLGRRQEIELFWLSISTGLWFLRNYQFFGQTVPFNMALYNVLPIYATYFASAATAAFYFCYVKLPQRRRLITALFLFGIPLVLTHAFLFPSDLIIYLPS